MKKKETKKFKIFGLTFTEEDIVTLTIKQNDRKITICEKEEKEEEKTIGFPI